MKRQTTRIALVCVSIALLSLATWPALAAPGTDPEANRSLAEVRRATAQYHDVDAAIADGYTMMSPCVEVAGLGGMGHHALNPALISDGVIDPLRPEVLLYEPRGDGRLALVAVEYLLPAMANTSDGPAPWYAATPPPGGFVTPPPQIFGVTFEGPMPGHGAHEPWHYDRHLWIWKANPNGLFGTWNPNVNCP